MQTVVGVLRGGEGAGHEASIKSGAAVLAALDPSVYRARDIYIDANGQWHQEGRPVSPERALRQLDCALLPLHGAYGERGEVQRLLESYAVPYAASNPFASHLAAHAPMARAQLQEAGLTVPDSRYVESVADAHTAAYEVTRAFHPPVVVRRALGGYAGAAVVSGYAPIQTAIERLFTEGADAVVVEEYLRGREAAAGVVEGLRGEQLYALIPVELAADGVRCPGGFSRVEAEELAHEAKVAHRTLGLRHASESHFKVTPRGVRYLGTTSLPALSGDESFAVALGAVGVSLAAYLAHLINRMLG